MWYILPFVIEDHWSPANFFRTWLQESSKVKGSIVCMKSEMQIQRFYLVGQTYYSVRSLFSFGTSWRKPPIIYPYFDGRLVWLTLLLMVRLYTKCQRCMSCLSLRYADFCLLLNTSLIHKVSEMSRPFKCWCFFQKRSRHAPTSSKWWFNHAVKPNYKEYLRVRL